MLKSCLSSRSHRLEVLFLFPITFLFILSTSLVFSAEIKLAWDANTEPDLAGYKIYYGTSPRIGTDPKSCSLCGYSTVVTTGKVTSYTLGNLITGQNYYVSLTATDSSSNESGFSNEVSGTAKDPTSTQNYTIITNPAGLQITVDGTTYTAPQTFIWSPGSSHNLSLPSPQGGTGTRYVFSSWSDGGSQSHTVTMPASGTTYTANFLPQYSLTVSVSPVAGGTAGLSGVNWYNSGQNVSVSATANAGYSFSSWTGDQTGSANPISLTMGGPKSVTANFTQNQYTLTVSVNPSGAGSVTKSPNKSTYVYGEQVTLTATANTGYTFSSWSGGASGTTSPTTITINSNKAVTANFTQNQYTLTVSVNPSGAGSVTKSPNKSTYVYGEQVTLTATANTGYTFSSWSGGASGTTSPTTVTINSNKAVTANFTQNQYTLTVSVNPSGAGSVTKSPNKSTYVYGEQVTLTASANPGYTFGSWSGGLTGSSNPSILTMSGAKNVAATFTQEQPGRIALKAGPNLISFPNLPGEVPIANLLSSISGQYDLVYAYEGCDQVDPWRIYDPSLPAFVNDLQNIDPTMGVWIEMTQDSEINVSGSYPPTLSIPLCAGWNLISYAGNQAKPITDALSSIAGKYLKVYTYEASDPIDPWKIFDSSVPPFVNDLATLEPGVGYWINVNQNCTFVINNN